MAETFADTLRQMEEVECYAAASRTLKRAEEFAREYGFEKAYGATKNCVKIQKLS